MSQDEIKEDDFDEVYKPVQNHIDTNAGWSGTLFDTHGEEGEYVHQKRKENPKTIWTLVDEGDDMTIIAGMHFVNRMGYFITEKEWVTGDEYVPQDMRMGEDEEG